MTNNLKMMIMLESQFQGAAHQGWSTLFGGLAAQAFTGTEAPSTRVEPAIRAATIRRTFFITKKGYLGLGPAKMRHGDQLFILLGSPTPLILRDAGQRRVPRMFSQAEYGYRLEDCFEVIGDTYVHGLMDGEGMLEWKQLTDLTFEIFCWRKKVRSPRYINLSDDSQYHTKALDLAYAKWKGYDRTLSAWNDELTGKDVRTRLAHHTNLHGNSFNVASLNEFERMVVLSMREGSLDWHKLSLKDGYEGEVLIENITLDIWRDQVYQMRGIESTIRVAKLARHKIQDTEHWVKYWRSKMDEEFRTIKSSGFQEQERGSVYLV